MSDVSELCSCAELSEVADTRDLFWPPERLTKILKNCTPSISFRVWRRDGGGGGGGGVDDRALKSSYLLTCRVLFHYLIFNAQSTRRVY